MIPSHETFAAKDFLARLRQDSHGNTLALIAAGLVPLLALVGGGVDMGRSYLSQSRLQQACDAGVLAARKKLGSAVAVDGIVPADVATIGNRFFNVNFRDGSYGTANRDFEMTLEEDYSISGAATVDVPTTIMTLFGYTQMPISVSCEARLNFSNTDIMFVLDTTGSMKQTIDGDGDPKIDVLRQVVKNFHAQLEASKSPDTRVRYGFVPYSSNVNVGYLLKSGWMVDKWTYQGREPHDTGRTRTEDQWDSQYTDLNTNYTYITPYESDECPDSDDDWDTISSTVDASGYTVETIEVDGTYYWCTNPGADSDKYVVGGTIYDDYRYIHRYKMTGTIQVPIYDWRYKPVEIDVSSLKGASDEDLYVGGSIDVPMGGSPDEPGPLTGWFRGCIEERATYQINDYDAVDLTQALDLDIDLVPTPGVPATQWRPMLNEFAFNRSVRWSGRGSFTIAEVDSSDDFFQPHDHGMSACPTSSRLLEEMDASQISSYVDSLEARGSTYHDIGMIWGGRLLSPTGLFAAENADIDGKSTSRHLIFLTDGQTATLDLTYGTYGVEPLNSSDNSRWDGGNSPSLTETVEGRFVVACKEVKKRNVTIWVIAFGTAMSPIFTECADEMHTFEAATATELDEVFSKIAGQMGDLRISK
jgi:Putative Flp pilus-assembly TadE/G-like